MSKLARLVDFQVYVRPGALGSTEQRTINEALFTTYEPLRLWLKENEIRAPFRELVIAFAHETTSSRWHGHVSNALGICEVTEALDPATLAQHASDHRWVLGLVKHALSCVAQSVSWRSAEIEGFVTSMSERALPLVHFFDRLAQVDKASGITCVPWISVRPGETRVGVRLGDRDVTVTSKAGPLYLEDAFPLAKTALREGAYVLLDKTGKQLASIALDRSALLH